MNRGRFIVVEGFEGAGKSTQAERLAAFLSSKGLPVVATREPGGTAIGEGIRELLLHRGDARIEPVTELLLILAARSAFVTEVVEPALADGQWVVSDRFDLSTFAYQGFGRRIERDRIAELNRCATGGLVPDLYLVLDIAVEEGRARQAREGKARDRFESEGPGFLRRVRRGYVELAESTEGAVLVPSGGKVDEVEDMVRRQVGLRFPETFGAGGV